MSIPLKCLNIAVIADSEDNPIATKGFKGNTNDLATFHAQKVDGWLSVISQKRILILCFDDAALTKEAKLDNCYLIKIEIIPCIKSEI